MEKINFKAMTAIQRLFLLRTLAIIIQLATVLTVYFVMSLEIALLPLLGVIMVETAFHGFSILLFKKRPAGHYAIVGQIFADVIFLSVLLSLSGGATNAFVSLLLLPIVIAAVSLPLRFLSFISLSAIGAYSLLLIKMPSHLMHQMDMSNHFIGMWANFLISVIVVSFVVGAMAKAITNRERAIAKYQEEQLRSEQLLALGAASAQITHQLATPLANIQLLFDELHEDLPNNEAIVAMEHPLEQCKKQLAYFRTLATTIREEQKAPIKVDDFFTQFMDLVQLHFPTHPVDFINPKVILAEIESDPMLLPALLNLVQNGIRANTENQQNSLALTIYCQGNILHITLRDFGTGISSELNKNLQHSLGEKLVKSESGFGMAVLLSNSTFSRLGGSLKLSNHPEKGCVAHVTLPLIHY
jgi:two-component system sensor histidine kinase RegB